jgi:predicted AAA+ superfamily ATPase
MYIRQKHIDNIAALLKPGKAVVVYGARRTGKTTLVNEYMRGQGEGALSVSGEDIDVRHYLSSESIEKLSAFVGNNRLLVVDEAQKVPNIGLNLKLILDHIPDMRIIATGSSSFDLARNIGEPLTGRKYTLRLFPLAQMELSAIENPAQTSSRLESRLLYGSYPEIVLMEDNRERERYLKEIVSSYLYKDILELDGIRHASSIARLLQLVAFQLGREVSFSELAGHLGMSKNTVERYLDLLEKAFVIIRMHGFSRNLRKEITKNCRLYFIDTGIRNALVNNFNVLDMRDDTGMLWENYLVMERLKKQEYTGDVANNYFWRTYSKQEIDLVEERGGKLFGYEMKWGKQRAKAPTEWLKSYPEASWQTISRDNYIEFIT